jgi:biopolymer transport protein TolQ
MLVLLGEKMLKYLSNMSPVILVVLLALIFFSIVSWAIIVYKMIQIATVKKNTRVFLDFFWGTKEFSLINAEIDRFRDCPLASMFKEGYRETEHFLSADPRETTEARLSTDSSAIENIGRSLRKISGLETDKLERNIGFLATTGSTTPFIGLFGTVWGIMIAFRNIGLAGSTSLDIVAPGISEALITTAIGLAVAIPAVIGYNYIQGKIRGQISEIDNFSYDFLNIVQRSFNAKK